MGVTRCPICERDHRDGSASASVAWVEHLGTKLVVDLVIVCNGGCYGTWRSRLPKDVTLSDRPIGDCIGPTCDRGYDFVGVTPRIIGWLRNYRWSFDAQTKLADFVEVFAP